MNEIFEKSVDAINGSLVAIVNPSDEATLAAKAPQLWAWSGNGQSERFIVRESAADFLTELRRLMWANFLNRLLGQGAAAYNALTGRTDDIVSLPDSLSVEDIYRLKEDACGSPANTVSRIKRPSPAMDMVGAVHFGLRKNGAEPEGSTYLLNGQRIRILNAQGQLLTGFRSLFEHEPTPFMPADVLVCVGAKDDGGLPLNIARRNKDVSTVVRPAIVGEWMTEDQAEQFWRPAANVSAS